MKCPIDETQLAITERQGVEIDYCPQCRGVWLDRGELDKIIEKADGAGQRSEYDSRRRDDDDDHHRRRDSDDYRRDHDDDYRHNDHHYKKKHKENFLGEFFDF